MNSIHRMPMLPVSKLLRGRSQHIRSGAKDAADAIQKRLMW